MDLPLEALPVVYEAVAEEKHLDRFGHVNVMWYTHFFDEATLGLFERLGCGTSYYTQSGHGMFALEQHTRYLRELRSSDVIEVRARLLGAGPKRIHFMLFLTTGGGSRLSATSELVGMHVRLAHRRSVPMPTVLVQAIADLLSDHRSLPWTAPACGVMSA